MLKSPLTRFGLLAIFLTLVATNLTVATVQAEDLKLGIFDKQVIVDQSRIGLAAKDRFEAVQAEREQEVAAKQKALEDLTASYQQRAAVLSSDKRLDLQRELARAEDEYQSAKGNADRDLQRAYQSALLDIVTKIDPVVRAFGHEKGYDFLFDVSQVAFNLPQHDVTAQLISRMDAAYPEG